MSDEIAFVVMAAGLGSRYNGTKQLETFGKDGLTISEYNMQHAIDAGFRKFFFIINDSLAEVFNSRLKSFLPQGCSFGLIYQRKEDRLSKFCNRVKPWGTAHAIMCCEKAICCNFCVTNADDLYGRDAIFKMADFLKKNDKKSNTFANVVYSLNDTLSDNGSVSRGVVEVDELSNLKSITEMHGLSKDDTNVDSESFVSMNLWGFTPQVFDLLKDEWEIFKANVSDMAKDEFCLPTVVNDKIREKLCKVRVLKTTSKWRGITYKTDGEALEKALSE